MLYVSRERKRRRATTTALIDAVTMCPDRLWGGDYAVLAVVGERQFHGNSAPSW